MAKMFRIYSVIQRPKAEDYWLNIGAAFRMKTGRGSTCCCRRCLCTEAASWSCGLITAQRKRPRVTLRRHRRSAEAEAG